TRDDHTLAVEGYDVAGPGGAANRVPRCAAVDGHARGVTQRGGAGNIGAEKRALDDVGGRAGAGNVDPGAGGAADDVARGRRGAAHDVVAGEARGGALDEQPLDTVAHRRGAAGIGADLVALHDVVVGVAREVAENPHAGEDVVGDDVVQQRTTG